MIAFVTGASRGIGKACAVELAKVGYDVAISARTVAEGEEREHSSTVKKSDTRPLPGSLDTTAELIEAEGRRALKVAADLTDRASLEAAAARVLTSGGGSTCCVNNGRYIGPGHMDALLDTPIELLDKHLEANALAPLVLIQALLPGDARAGLGPDPEHDLGRGLVRPAGPAGKGGWGLGYAMSKGALHRVAGVLAHEVAGTGVDVVNVSPGLRGHRAHRHRHGRVRLRRLEGRHPHLGGRGGRLAGHRRQRRRPPRADGRRPGAGPATRPHLTHFEA